MQTLGLLVVPVLVLGFYQRFLRFSLRFILRMFMDFSPLFKFITLATELTCGILLLGYFSPIFNLFGLLLIFIFCLRFLRSSPKSDKSGDENIKNGGNNNNNNNNNSSNNNNGREENVNAGVEDEVFDVMSLRKMVKAERQRYNAACAEIEKEQGAAASAAEEAMAMILRLQSEKSAVEIQAKQFRRVVEQKQEYDLEVMESLRWTAEQVESQKNLVERQLKVLRERLRHFLDEREMQQLQAEQEKEEQNEQDIEEHDMSDIEEQQHDMCDIEEQQQLDLYDIEEQQRDMSDIDEEQQRDMSDIDEEQQREMSVIEEEQHDMCRSEEEHGLCKSEEEHGMCKSEEEHGMCKSEEEHGLCKSEEQHDMCKSEEQHDICEIEEEHDLSEIEEEEDVIGTCTGTASVSDDADSSGFLNFSVEYDVDIIADDSSQNHSPTHNLAQQQQL